jgi:hypothetical protein
MTKSKLCYDWWSVGLSQCQAPRSGAQEQILITFRPLRLLLCGALSDQRTGLLCTTDAGPCQHYHSQVWVPQDSWTCFFYCLKIGDSSNLEAQVPYFLYSPRNRVGQALGSLFVASYICRATVEVFESKRPIVTDCQSVSLCVQTHLGLMTRYLLLFDSYGLVFS